MKVSEIMTQRPIKVDSSATAKDVAEIMERENVGTVLVVKGDRLEGLVTDRQILTKVLAVGKDPKKINVNEFMTKDPITANPDMEIEKISQIIGQKGYRRIPIVEEERLVGIISIADIAEHARTCNVCTQYLFDEIAKSER